jgi:hypothetical protein
MTIVSTSLDQLEVVSLTSSVMYGFVEHGGAFVSPGFGHGGAFVSPASAVPAITTAKQRVNATLLRLFMGFSSKRAAEILESGRNEVELHKIGLHRYCLRAALNTSEARLTQVFYQPI